MTDLEKKDREIELLKKTNKSLLEAVNREAVNNRKSKNPNWLIFLRDPLKNSGHWIYGIIKFLFMLLIIFSIVFSFKFFSKEFYTLIFAETTKENSSNFINEIKNDTIKFNDIQFKYLSKKIVSNSEEIIKLKSNNKNLNILEFIEHIFIYLIPLLIILGLYYYFESNYKYHFLGSDDISKEEINHSKNALSLTKTLFISSIMSFVIIKVIEKVLLAKEGDFPTETELISYGVLLLLLMSYLILSHSHSNHNDKNEH